MNDDPSISIHLKQIFAFFYLFILSFSLAAMAPKISMEKAIDHAIIRYGIQTEPDLSERFKKAGIAYPPKAVSLLAFKHERTLQLWAKDEQHSWRYIRTYPLTAFSGQLGPKLKENDQQIPEGIYHLTAFNPFSAYHLSILIDYPNQFDRQQAKFDKRTKPGNEIFLHGKASSVGCLAVGNQGMDQLFLLARRVGLKNIKVIIAPNDFRKSKPLTAYAGQPKWLPRLYHDITLALKPFKLRNH